MRMQASSFLLATVLIAGSVGAATAQGLGGGETKTPNSPVTSPNDPGINNPNSPTTSNRGDPGTEPVNLRNFHDSSMIEYAYPCSQRNNCRLRAKSCSTVSRLTRL